MAVNLVGVTTINRAPLYRAQPGISVATLYTVPAATDLKIASIILSNTSGLPATATLYTVPNAGAAGVTNEIVPAVSVNANQIVTIDTPIYMTSGDFIAGLQGTAGAITVTISGETYA